jgi:probable rRNA maturation factor
MSELLDISCANLQSRPIDESRLINALRTVLSTAGATRGEISLTIVDNARIHELNRQHLAHDYPTDVLSFLLDRDDDRLDGEIIVSADYAAEEAKRYGWPMEDELLLYVVHGALHLVGYDDTIPDAAAEMRRQERAILGMFGLNPPGRE